ncbi:MAG: NADH-quinone oxidoreductase subunit M, partial [Nitrospinota bacterium]|nr:NADH-quinone oxidoreductase subunit M [Nitrospinota bacterium]
MTNVLGIPILTYMIFIPLAGAVVMMLFFPREKTGAIKNFSFVVSLLVLALSLWLLPGFEAENVRMQYVEEHAWIPSLGVKYFIGVDGISILLIVLTTLLSAVSILCSYKAVQERQKEYYVSLLILETGMLGVFVSLDLFLFYVFWEIMLVPMYFLIGIWGGPRKLYAAIKFFLYTLVGSVLLLLGFLALYFLNANPEYGSGELTFNLLELYKMAPRLPAEHQFWIFLALFVGFAIKVPMFPFHTWLPDAHVEAPTAGSVILAGVLLKMGTYGFVRFSLPLLPKASETMIPFMALLAIIGIIYGALVAMAQSDVKKLVAYSSVSHLGFVMLGIFALNSQGLVGALLQNINHGLSTGALFLIVGIIYERRH